MGWQVWKDAGLAEGIIELFEVEADEMKYRDIMPAVAVLLNSGMKGWRVKRLIVKLMERKKRLESLEVGESASSKRDS